MCGGLAVPTAAALDPPPCSCCSCTRPRLHGGGINRGPGYRRWGTPLRVPLGSRPPPQLGQPFLKQCHSLSPCPPNLPLFRLSSVAVRPCTAVWRVFLPMPTASSYPAQTFPWWISWMSTPVPDASQGVGLIQAVLELVDWPDKEDCLLSGVEAIDGSWYRMAASLIAEGFALPSGKSNPLKENALAGMICLSIIWKWLCCIEALAGDKWETRTIHKQLKAKCERQRTSLVVYREVFTSFLSPYSIFLIDSEMLIFYT